MIRDLMEAAKVAREASTVTTDRRTVEVLITELGLVVRARYRDARHAISATRDVGWDEIERLPRLATNAVRVAIRSLENACEDAGAPPVRSGE